VTLLADRRAVRPKVTCTICSTPEKNEHCATWAFHPFDFADEEGAGDVVDVSV
jgi:hypothetical protein